MSETVDTTRPFSLIPEGKQTITILEIPIKKRTKNGDNFIYVFKFGYVIDGKRKTWTAYFMPWDLGILLQALDFKQISEHSYEWEREQCKGRILNVVIEHQPDSNDKTKIWPRIIEAKEVIGPQDEEDIAF